VAKTAHAWLVLPHAVPVLVVLATTAGFAVLARGGLPAPGELARLLLAMLGGQLAIGAVNEVVDADLDAVAQPAKPIPAGYVSVRAALWLTVGSLVVMAVFAAGFGPWSLVLCALGTGAGLAYDVWAKRTLLSWLPYLVALPLLPIWVWMALSEVDPGLFAIYPVGAAAVVAVQIAQSIPDIAADTKADVRTLAAVLGADRARLVCWGSLILAAMLAATLAPWLTEAPRWVWIAAVLAGAPTVLNAAIWRRDARTGALACFPIVAGSAVVLGIGWTLALVGA